MTIANFSTHDSNEQVALSVAPGIPDVLSLMTTNIPQVHARLVELRQRADHPQSRPREIWIDLTGCESFSETRGEVLVRALRLTQFLPCGFIGAQPPVAGMARATHLPRVDTRDLLPRVALSATAPASAAPSVSRMEFEQREDIMADMGRRLAALQEENSAQTQRANVLSQAMGIVRGNRDQLETEVKELQSRLTRLSGELEWSKVQNGGAEGEIATLMARISQANAEREEASARAEALDGGMHLVEQALIESRREAYALQLRIQDMEENAIAREQVEALTSSLDQARQRADELAGQIASNEEAFATQRAEFLATNETLRTKVGELTAALHNSQQELEGERENMVALVASRDAVEKQSALTAQMLEDALTQVEDLTHQAADLGTQVGQYQAQWASVSEDYQRTREQLLSAQAEANQANVDLVSAARLAETRAQQIAQLTSDGATKDEALEGARQETVSLREALDQARHGAVEAEENLETARLEAANAEQAVASFRADLASKETLLADITTARAAALDRCRDLENTLAHQNEEVSTLGAQLNATRVELADAQIALLEASAEVVQVQARLDEARRANSVLNELTQRNERDLAAARGEVEGLTQRLGISAQALSEASAQIEEVSARERSSAVEGERRLALAKAEAESLSRRLASAQEDASFAAEQSGSVIEDLRESLTRQESINDEINQALSASRAELNASQEKVQSLSASIVRMQAQLQVSQGELEAARETVRRCETTIVEQQGRIEKIAGELESGRVEASSLREHVVVSDATIRRQQDQIDHGRQTIAHVSASLQQEQEAHSATRRECATAINEVSRLSGVVDSQAAELVSVSGDLVRVQGVCEDQAGRLATAEAHVADVERAARIDRRQRAQLETELVDVQEKLACVLEAKTEVVPTPGPVVIEVPVAVPAPVQAKATINHRDRVRTGQIITSDGDLVVLKSVSGGAELRAVGSVHIYGAMSGRVHAGCQGDRSARIYCSNFAAEQVAIAGKVVHLETVPPTLRGHSVEIWLDSKDVMQIRAADME